jgi:hypothetical protein
MAYSGDWREAAIAFKQAGHTSAGLKEAFGIALPTYCNWLKKKKRRTFKTQITVNAELRRLSRFL